MIYEILKEVVVREESVNVIMHKLQSLKNLKTFRHYAIGWLNFVIEKDRRSSVSIILAQNVEKHYLVGNGHL